MEAVNGGLILILKIRTLRSRTYYLSHLQVLLGLEVSSGLDHFTLSFACYFLNINS